MSRTVAAIPFQSIAGAHAGQIDHACARGVRHAEAGIAHAQRREDVPMHVGIERFPAHHLHDTRQHFDAGAVVFEAGSRFGGQRHLCQARGKRRQVRGCVQIRTFQQPRGLLEAFAAGGEAGRMGEQLAQGDRALHRRQHRLVRCAAREALQVRECRQVTADRIVQSQLALLHQLEQRH